MNTFIGYLGLAFIALSLCKWIVVIITMVS